MLQCPLTTIIRNYGLMCFDRRQLYVNKCRFFIVSIFYVTGLCFFTAWGFCVFPVHAVSCARFGLRAKFSFVTFIWVLYFSYE